MHGPFILLLQHEYASRHEGPVPPPHELVWLSWVPEYLRVMFPPPVLPVDTDPLCACGHFASEHPLDGACACCGCLGYGDHPWTLDVAEIGEQALSTTPA